MATALPALTELNFKAGLRRLAQSGRPHIEYKRLKVLQALTAFERVVIALDDQELPKEEQYIHGVAFILQVCRQVDVLGSGVRASEFSVFVVREWLKGSPFDFVPSPETVREINSVLRNGAERPGEFASLLSLVGNCCFDRETARKFEAITGEPSNVSAPLEASSTPLSRGPVRGFTSISMTGDGHDFRLLTEVSERVSQVAGEFGIVCFQPIVETSPLVSREAADHPRHHDLDEAQLAETDVVFIVADPPGIGLGAVSELAIRAGADRVILKSASPLTPMLTGARSLAAIIDCGATLEQELRRELARLLPRLEMRRDDRERKISASKGWIESVSAGLSELDSGALTAPMPYAPIGRRRFTALMRNASLIPGMTVAEREFIESLTGPQELPGGLPPEAARALFGGEAQGWWRESETPGLIKAALRSHFRAQADEQILMRRGWVTVPWWVKLHESLEA